jgi:formylglycine-generating enzyme required for sulfatase activity
MRAMLPLAPGRLGALLLAGVLVSSASPGLARQEAAFRESIAGTLATFEMVRVPAGFVTLDTGSGARTIAVPGFFIGRTEVTWDLYDVFHHRLDEPAGLPAGADAVARPSEPYGAPDRGWGHAAYPAMSLTREAAEGFCRWLSARTGKAYRLPTEAEWVRVATLAVGRTPLDAVRHDALAWHAGNSDRRSHPVGKRAPDALGLFDLFGNVAEWVTTDDDARVVRGGSHRDAAVGPGARAIQDERWNETDPQLPKSRWWLSDGPFVGFRLVMASPAGAEETRPE